MRQLSLGALAMLTASAQAGCSPLSMAKRGFTELRGAHGAVYSISPAPPGFYENLSGINVGEVRNSIEPVCSPRMCQRIEVALRNEAAEASQRMGGAGGPCTVNVDLSFNKEPGGARALIGKGALLIGRASVYDTDAGQVADFLVLVGSKAMRTTSDEMAEEFASTLVGSLRENGD